MMSNRGSSHWKIKSELPTMGKYTGCMKSGEWLEPGLLLPPGRPVWMPRRAQLQAAPLSSNHPVSRDPNQSLSEEMPIVFHSVTMTQHFSKLASGIQIAPRRILREKKDQARVAGLP